jgi:hypothetical protein
VKVEEKYQKTNQQEGDTPFYHKFLFQYIHTPNYRLVGVRVSIVSEDNYGFNKRQAKTRDLIVFINIGKQRRNFSSLSYKLN